MTIIPQYISRIPAYALRRRQWIAALVTSSLAVVCLGDADAVNRTAPSAMDSQRDTAYDYAAEYGYILSMTEAQLKSSALLDVQPHWQHRISAENSATEITAQGRIDADWRYRWETFLSNIGENASRAQLLVDVVDEDREWYGYGQYDWVFLVIPENVARQAIRWHLLTAVEYGYFEDQQEAVLTSSERFQGASVALQRDVQGSASLNLWEFGIRWQGVEHHETLSLPLRTVSAEYQRDLLLPFLHWRFQFSGDAHDTLLDLYYEQNIGDDEQSRLEIFLEGGQREVNFRRLEAELWQRWWLGSANRAQMLRGFFSYDLRSFQGFGDALISDGQWSVGGKHSVRAYDDQISSADSGNLLRLELGYYYLHPALRESRLFLFFDTGRYKIEASEIQVSNRLPSEEQRMSLQSNGIGAELYLHAGLRAEVIWGRVLKSVTDLAERGDHRLHLSVSWTF